MRMMRMILDRDEIEARLFGDVDEPLDLVERGRLRRHRQSELQGLAIVGHTTISFHHVHSARGRTECPGLCG
jgi:hypothetical protein